ncbi:hypothetical protein [Pectobacterium carotovorum]|uniref:hypothetical protein n=1 Tax=Pectobacterium carotovorum TaxID=554 RepID=UPI00057E6E8D|nr:hypothetical protein [Pectobacterium carotovorum]KHT34398.1 hypothetical protein RD01_05770 [Pectobacterium carotovorum subsp. carotovorum]
MMQKVHQLNGFEFSHDRFNLDGQWIFSWYFRPTGKHEWCYYSLPSGKTKKSDVIKLLEDNETASAYYQDWLDGASDVEAAELRLSRARDAWTRISHPDWGGRGNNPNSDALRVKQARYELENAERGLESAKALKDRLSK